MPAPALALLALFDGIGFSEILMVGFVAVLVYGGRLPEVMRSFGQAYAKFRRGLNEASQPLREEIQRATTLPAEVSTPMADLEPHAAAHAHAHPSVPYTLQEDPAGAAGPGDLGAEGAGAPAPAPAPGAEPSPWPRPDADAGAAPSPGQHAPAAEPPAAPSPRPSPPGLDEPPPV